MIYNNNQHQVAVYKFVDVVGCRTTGSVKHSHLPVPSTRDKPFVIQDQSKVRVGFQYLFGYNHEYKVQDGKIELSSPRDIQDTEAPNLHFLEWTI